jgi:hypothetical protein
MPTKPISERHLRPLFLKSHADFTKLSRRNGRIMSQMRSLEVPFMTGIRTIVFAVMLCAMPAAAFAAGAGAGSGASPDPIIPNPVPGGITLVPGTVVTPGVSGSAVTGTVPLAGTIGSFGVRNLNPGLGPTPNPDAAGNGNTLYPPTYYPQIPSPNLQQSTLPQGAAGLPNANGIPPAGACTYGAC